MISVSTNTTALTAQRYLNINSSMSSSSIAKMSSGSRIVKASDDAASLAISNKLRADIAALQQANNNAGQGASLLQVASGGLNQIGDILTRMKTLSTQVVNGTLSTSERQFANQEFAQLITQVGNVASQTEVNGIAMLNGGDKTLAGLNAADVNYAVSTQTASANYFAAGAVTAASVQGSVNGTVESVDEVNVGATGASGRRLVDIKIGGEVFRGDFGTNAQGTDVIRFTSLTNNQNSFGVIANAAVGTAITTTAIQNELRVLFNVGVTGTAPVNFRSGALTTANTAALLTAGGGALSTVLKASGATADGIYNVTSSYTAANATTGASEFVTLRLQGSDGKVYEAIVNDENTGTANSLTTATTKTVKFANGVEMTFDAARLNGLAVAPAAATGVNAAWFGASNATAFRFQVSQGALTTSTFQIGASSSDTVSISFDAMTTTSLGIGSLNIETITGAQAASNAIDTAINKVNSATAYVGALQSRLEYIQNNLATVTENIQAANGIFKDVDMAKEMTNFTKSQTLSQAGISMLSQANQMPQLLLRLLQ